MSSMNFLPRTPLSTGKSGSMDVPDNYTRQMLSWRDAARSRAISEFRAMPESGNVPKYIDAIEGRFWNRDRPDYRSRFVDNMVAAARLDKLSTLTDIRSVIDVKSAIEDHDSRADILANVVRDQWLRYDMDLALVEVVDHAALQVGYWKIDAVPGRLIVNPCGADSVLPIQCTRHIQDSAGVLYRAVKGKGYFERVFGDRGKQVVTKAPMTSHDSSVFLRPWNIPEYTWNNFTLAMKRLMTAKNPQMADAAVSSHDVFPVASLEEYWVEDYSINESNRDIVMSDPNHPITSQNFWYTVKPGDRLFPRKRLIVFGGDKLLYDSTSPYWSGLYPFARLRLRPTVWGPGGLSAYRPLLPINMAVNEIGAGVLDMIRRSLNQQLITRDGVVRDAAWQRFLNDKPGSKLRISANANPTNDIRYGPVPVIPAYVLQMLMQYLIPTFAKQAGTLDQFSLSSKLQVPGADTIEQMRSLQPSHHRLEQRYIDAFLRDAGVIAIPLIIQFFNAKQRMSLLGPDGITWSDFDFDPGSLVPAGMAKEELARLMSIRISTGSMNGQSQDRKKQIALALRRMGAISRRELLRTLEWGNEDQIIKELEEESAANMPDPGGRTPRLSRGARTGSPV